MTLTDPDAEAPAPPVRVRYRNRGGALVLITEHPDASAPLRYAGECTGCLEEFGRASGIQPVRDWASSHARECRALPQPEPQS